MVKRVFILTCIDHFLGIKIYQLDQYFYLIYESVPFKPSMSHSKFLSPLRTYLCKEPMFITMKQQFDMQIDQISPVKMVCSKKQLSAFKKNLLCNFKLVGWRDLILKRYYFPKHKAVFHDQLISFKL
jgi:hypothetical protein